MDNEAIFEFLLIPLGLGALLILAGLNLMLKKLVITKSATFLLLVGLGVITTGLISQGTLITWHGLTNMFISDQEIWQSVLWIAAASGIFGYAAYGWYVVPLWLRQLADKNLSLELNPRPEDI